MTDRYEEIKNLIADHSDIAEFADFGDGVSVEWIEKAESSLNIKLPPSYKWWLRNYSGGDIGGEEIFSIYEQDFDTVVGGDIVHMHRLNQKQGLCKPTQLIICLSDVDGPFYFDIADPNEDGEYPVFSKATGTLYAEDFLEFLTKRIDACTE